MEEEALRLLCFGGEAAPTTLATDLGELLQMPAGVQANFWQVLGPCLAPKLDPETDRAIDAFARSHGVDGNQVARAIRGCRLLFYEAARSSAERHAFAADLGTLAGDRAEVLSGVLLPRFDAAMRKIREEIVQRSVFDHGAVLVDVDWRVDRVLSSQHGRAVDAKVAIMTLSLRQGDATTRVTLQADTTMIQHLRHVCDKLLE